MTAAKLSKSPFRRRPVKGLNQYPQVLLRPPKELLDRVRTAAYGRKMGIGEWVQEAMEIHLTHLIPTPKKEAKSPIRGPESLLDVAAAAVKARNDWAIEWPRLRAMAPAVAFSRFKELRGGREPGPPSDLVKMPEAEAVKWLQKHYPIP